MFGRVYFGAHWIGDTLAGILIGYFVSLMLTPFFFQLFETLFGKILPPTLFHLLVCFHSLVSKTEQTRHEDYTDHY